MELTTLELAKILIEKSDKIEPTFRTAFSENDGGYYIILYLEENRFNVVLHENYIYVSKEGYPFTISIDKNIDIDSVKLQIKELVFKSINKIAITPSIESENELKEKLMQHIIKKDINYILEYKK
jgi:hypothetical protein